MESYNRRELFEKVTSLFSSIDTKQLQENFTEEKKLEYSHEGDSYTFEPETRTVTVRSGMSRRAFLAVAGVLGVSFALTGADGSTWGIAQAFANEDDYGFTIIVLTKEDVGFLTIDPSTSTRIGNMHVTITSRANAKKVEATTNASGQGYANIRELATNPSKDALSYSFWGSIKATKQGYRTFESGLVRVNGGPPPKDTQPLAIPSQKDTGEPYAVKLTYDGYDIQYFTTTILLSKKNDAVHSLEVSLAHVDSTTVSLWHNGSKIAESKTEKQQGYAVASFYGRYNQSFLKDKKTSIRFTANNKTYEIETKLVCFADEAMDGVSYGDKALAPGGFSDSTSGSGGDEMPALSVKIPKDFPVFGGASINLDLPSLPIYAYLTPFGTAVITTNINDLEFLEDDKGNLAPDKEWKVSTKESWSDWRKRLKDDWDKAKARHTAAKALAADPKAKTTTTPFSEKSKLKAVFATSAMLEWKYYDAEKAKRWTGSYDASVGLSYSYSYTRQLTIGPVPVYLGFDITLSGSAATSSAVSIKSFFEDIKWVPGARQWSFTAGFEFGVSAGVGISGFVALGIRGMAGISITFAYVLNPPAGNDTRHLFSYLSAGVQFVLQALCFKASGNLYKLDPPVKIFDSWNNALPVPTVQGPDQTLTWEIMTQDDLGLYNEAVGEIPDENGLDPLHIAIGQGVVVGGEAGSVLDAQETTEDDEILLTPQDSAQDASGEGAPVFGMQQDVPADDTPEANNPQQQSNNQGTTLGSEAGEATGGQVDEGQSSDGQAIDDQATGGQAANGQAAEGPAPTDQAPQNQTLETQEALEPQNGRSAMGEGILDPFALTTYTVTSTQTTGASCAKLGVLNPFDEAAGYDIAEGPRPSTEVIIYKDAYTDPRTKTVVVGDDLYMIRFVTVKVKWGLWTYNITRLAISKYDSNQSWSKPEIIDFELREDNPTGKRRTYVYDYDFDVVATEENRHLHFMITSGTRPGVDSDKVEWYEAANHMMASYFCYDLASKKVTSAVSDFTVYDTMTPDGLYRQAQFPRIERSGNAVFALYCSKGASTVGGGYGDIFLVLWRSITGGDYVHSANGVYPEAFTQMAGQYGGAYGIKDAALSRAPQAYQGFPAFMLSFEYTVDVTTNTGSKYSVAGVYPGVNMGNNTGVNVFIKGGALYGALAKHTHSGFIIPINLNEATGATQLAHITTDGAWADTSYVIGWVNRGSSFMASEDGKYLFTTSMLEGKMPKPTSDEEVFGAEADPSLTDVFDNVGGGDKKLYQLYATRYYESTKSFSPFFPFAQLSSPVDSLEHLRFTGNAQNSDSMAFIYNSIVDPAAKPLHANMYFASVPFICSIQLEGFACQEDFVGVGDTCHLVFNVVNTGNLGISSFNAKLCTDKDGKNIVAELKLNDLAHMVMLSEEHLDPETGEQELTEADKTGVFLPGEKRLYKSTFVVPTAWKDKKEVELFVFVYAPTIARVSDGFTAFGESWTGADPYIDTYTSDALPSEVSLDLSAERTGSIDGLSGGLYRSWTEGGTDPGTGNLPRTNDNSLPLIAAAVGAAAASGVAFGMKALKDRSIL